MLSGEKVELIVEYFSEERDSSGSPCKCPAGFVAWKWECYPQVEIGQSH